MKKIYQATNIKKVEKALNLFEEKWFPEYGYAKRSWRNNFDELVTFFELPSEIIILIYKTNPIKNLNWNSERFLKTRVFKYEISFKGYIFSYKK